MEDDSERLPHAPPNGRKRPIRRNRAAARRALVRATDAIDRQQTVTLVAPAGFCRLYNGAHDTSRNRIGAAIGTVSAIAEKITAERKVLLKCDTRVDISENVLPGFGKHFHRIEAAQGRIVKCSKRSLAWVQQLAKLHRGVVAMDGALPRDTRFTPGLPLGKRPSVPPWSNRSMLACSSCRSAPASVWDLKAGKY